MADFSAMWTEVRVQNRPIELFRPVAEPRLAVIWLHGFDETPIRGRGAVEQAFAEQELLVACPTGGRCWWLDRLCPEFDPALTPARHVAAVADWLAAERGIPSTLVALAGVGMGGQGAVNLGFRHARRFPVVAAIAPDIDFHQWHGRGTPLDAMFPTSEAARQETATLHLHPLNWPRHLLLACDPDDAACFEGTERLASKLASTGIPFERDFETRAGGHTWAYFDRLIPQAAHFLGEALRQVARELPILPPTPRPA